MSDLKWKGRWNEINGKIKSAYADITDDDLQYQEGKEQEMLGRLQKKTGKSKKELYDWLNSL